MQFDSQVAPKDNEIEEECETCEQLYEKAIENFNKFWRRYDGGTTIEKVRNSTLGVKGWANFDP